MPKMLPRALVVAGVFALSSTQVGDTARAQMFENITVIGSPLVLSTLAEVDAAEAHLGMRFPTGYREYVTKFGEGASGRSSVRASGVGQRPAPRRSHFAPLPSRSAATLSQPSDFASCNGVIP
jgi:hypothetical protein